MRKTLNYWTKERCSEEASKYFTRTEFSKKAVSAYIKARKNKWLDEICKHMICLDKPNGFYTEEECKKEVLKFKTIKEFKLKSPSYYNYIIKNNWTDLISKLERKYAKDWTKDECQKESLKYKYKSEFQKKSKGAYLKALRNNWLIDICDHMILVGSLYKRCIYSIYFRETNTIYIGLTYNLEKRFNQHLSDKKSSVYDYIKSSGLKPELIKLTDYVDCKEAVDLEKYYHSHYKLNGFNILNRKECGDLGKNI